MTKNYAKFVPPKYRTSRRKPWRAEVVIALCLLVMGAFAIGGFIYVEKTQGTVATSQRVSAFITKMTALFHSKKTPPAAVKLAENKKLAASHSDAEPVRFDFYNALPNMQMPVENLQPPVPAAPPPASVAVVSDTPATSAATPPDATPETPSLPQTEEAPPTTAAAEPTVPESAPVTTAAITTPDTAAVTPVVATAATPVFNAKEITDLLAAEQGLTRYVVQLGVFQTEVAANRLRDAIASVGFPVRVVKSKQGNHRIYSVQQGPYDTAALAKSTQQRLAKRGIISTIQKA